MKNEDHTKNKYMITREQLEEIYPLITESIFSTYNEEGCYMSDRELLVRIDELKSISHYPEIETPRFDIIRKIVGQRIKT